MKVVDILDVLVPALLKVDDGETVLDNETRPLKEIEALFDICGVEVDERENNDEDEEVCVFLSAECEAIDVSVLVTVFVAETVDDNVVTLDFESIPLIVPPNLEIV